MGSTSSQPREKCSRGCWKFRKHYSIEDETNEPMKQEKQERSPRRPQKLTKLRVDSSASSIQCNIPTPSVLDHQWTSEDLTPQPPTQEKIMQIISCFPFPPPRNSPTTIEDPTPPLLASAPPTLAHIVGEEEYNEKAFSNAFGKLVQVRFD